MSKRAFDKIAAGLNDAIAITQGTADKSTYRVHIPEEIDVAAIRRKLKLTQKEFATRFGIPDSTLKDWEQKRRRPEGPARVLLMVIEKEPKAVERALSAA